ncbi:hypothetical protein A4G16_00780 [Mannheimia granulomatis]|uniref:Lipoprotein n=1 Tax=Mannheimia granulomatis TaxID=85402 RepID=A0A6G8JFQ5_9PAST|nr:hypothetical protein [Mannheimia granulomatis]QIM66010.1 hypothetical protein A4G16_00780 [Mannheimia granulomatis]
MSKFKLILLTVTVAGLFGCTPTVQKKSAQVGYLKANISQAELNNTANYKRYNYYCNNIATGETSFLATYFPLSRESRKQENFGIYFQLDGGKAEPFDHLQNRTLGGNKFEVSYRSYQPIDGSTVELIAREHSSTYYRNLNGTQVPWLECRQG